MAPARRQSNGRSPLVNKQSHITSFFSKSTPSPLPSKGNPKSPNLNPSPNNNNLPPSSPSSSPATPSPLHPKQKKSPLIIPSKPIPASTPSYGHEVVDRRIRVYWPLDDTWYEGSIALHDGSCKKHLVKYDDGEEELIDLGKEKIEWVEQSVAVKKKKFKRLRRGGDEAVVDERVLEECNANVFDDEEDGDGGHNAIDDDDDSEDEDWGKNLEKEMDEVGDDDMDVELDEEEEEDEKVRNKEKCGKRSVSRKRKAIGVEGVSSEKKSKGDVDGKNVVRVLLPESFSISESE